MVRKRGRKADERPLRGVDEPDRDAIDEAVKGLNRIYLQRGLETARELGEFVLAKFFGGNPAHFRDRGRDHVSFRALAHRDDLRVSYSFVWQSVAVVEQLRVLPADVAERLSVSHHVALLPLRDAGEKACLARTAAEEGWSFRELRDRVRERRSQDPEEPRRGRPPLPGVIKGLRRLDEAVEMAVSEPLTYRTLRRIDLQEPLPRVLERLDGIIEQLAGLRRALAESEFEAGKGNRRRK